MSQSAHCGDLEAQHEPKEWGKARACKRLTGVTAFRQKGYRPVGVTRVLESATFSPPVAPK